jgi:hypothetical protein
MDMQNRFLYITAAIVVIGAAAMAFYGDRFMGAPVGVVYVFSGVVIVFIAVSVITSRRSGGRAPEDTSAPGHVYEERRRAPRVYHVPKDRPYLQIDETEYEVMNISERGLRFANPQTTRFQRWIRGDLFFSDGNRLEIDGIVVRNHDHHISLQLLTTIPISVVEKESQHQMDRLRQQIAPAAVAKGETANT